MAGGRWETSRKKPGRCEAERLRVEAELRAGLGEVLRRLGLGLCGTSTGVGSRRLHQRWGSSRFKWKGSQAEDLL